MIESSYNHPSHHKKHHVKLIVFGIFLLVLSVLVITSFYNIDVPFTGSIVQKDLDPNESISISGNLDLQGLPFLDLNGDFEYVKIKGGSDSFLYLGDQKFPLGDSSIYSVILNNYDGKIYFNDENISLLKGKASRVSINGIPIMPKSSESVKVYTEGPLSYDFLEIQNEASIKEINYQTSGRINLNSTSINLRDDSLIIEDFQGDLKVDRRKFSFNGNIRSLSVEGSKDISVSV